MVLASHTTFNQYSMGVGQQGRVKKWRGKKGSAQCVVCKEDLKNNNLVIQTEYKKYGHQDCVFSPLAVGQQPGEAGREG